MIRLIIDWLNNSIAQVFWENREIRGFVEKEEEEEKKSNY